MTEPLPPDVDPGPMPDEETDDADQGALAAAEQDNYARAYAGLRPIATVKVGE